MTERRRCSHRSAHPVKCVAISDDDGSGSLRKQLGAFLRAKRQRLSPAQFGLPEGRRRRVTGLKREELALLAGVSHTWYMHLEQGRDIRPSAGMLRSVGRVMGLTDEEQVFIESLAEAAPGELASPSPQMDDQLRTIVEKMMPWPAILADYHLDVIFQNAAADLLVRLADAPKCGRNVNMLYCTFADPRPRQFLVDWETAARRLLGQFRVEASRYPTNPRFREIIDQLLTRDEKFRLMWSEFGVQAAHPKEGTLLNIGGRLIRVDMQDLTMSAAPNRRIHVMFPWGAADAAALDKSVRPRILVSDDAARKRRPKADRTPALPPDGRSAMRRAPAR